MHLLFIFALIFKVKSYFSLLCNYICDSYYHRVMERHIMETGPLTPYQPLSIHFIPSITHFILYNHVVPPPHLPHPRFTDIPGTIYSGLLAFKSAHS